MDPRVSPTSPAQPLPAGSVAIPMVDIDTRPQPHLHGSDAPQDPSVASSTDGIPSAPTPPHGVAASHAPAVSRASTYGLAQQGGLRIMFKDLTYSVPSNTKRGESAALLSGVSAFFEPNQMAALMGPSGSGKTTLIDLLAGRKTVGKTEGTLLFGGQRPTPAFLRRYTGYVEQFDTLLADLTVEEMLMYTAELKRPRSEPLASKRAAVGRLLDRLALAQCRDVKIGDPLQKGISGGQAKRVNVGIALITNPRVLFLDEPTSGLDSFTANGVMRVVKALARDGTTICATIHSPTASTFELFDQVLLLVRGRVAYFGAQGPDALAYAAAAWAHVSPSAAALALPDGKAPAAAVANEAEWLTEVITEADQRGAAGEVADAYDLSRLKKDNDALLEQYIAASTSSRHASRHGAGRGAGKSGRICCKALAPIRQKGSARRDGDSAYNSASNSAAAIAASIGEDERQQQQQQQYDEESPAPQAGPAAGSEDGDESSEDLAQAAGAAAAASEAQLTRELATRSSTVTPWWFGLWVMIKYRMSRDFRNPGWLGPRIGDKLLISLIILTLYLGIGDDFSQDSIVNMQSALFMWALLPAFGAASYVPTIVLERRLFLRERADGLYTVPTYLAFKLLGELALSAVITLVFASYVFYGVAFRGSFALFWLVYFLDLCVGIVLAYLVAALSPNMEVANAALPGYVVTLLFFAGQLMTFDAMPAYWQWYSKIDFIRYSWGALMINQFEDNDVEFTAGVSVLQYYGLKGADKWAYVAYLAAFWAVFAALALLALQFVRHQKR